MTKLVCACTCLCLTSTPSWSNKTHRKRTWPISSHLDSLRAGSSSSSTREHQRTRQCGRRESGEEMPNVEVDLVSQLHRWILYSQLCRTLLCSNMSRVACYHMTLDQRAIFILELEPNLLSHWALIVLWGISVPYIWGCIFIRYKEGRVRWGTVLHLIPLLIEIISWIINNMYIIIVRQLDYQ